MLLKPINEIRFYMDSDDDLDDDSDNDDSDDDNDDEQNQEAVLHPSFSSSNMLSSVKVLLIALIYLPPTKLKMKGTIIQNKVKKRT